MAQRVKVRGYSVEIGSPVVEITGEFLGITEVPPREAGRSPYWQIAVSQPTDAVSIRSYDPVDVSDLEAEEKYTFVCQVKNDTYGKALQAVFSYVGHHKPAKVVQPITTGPTLKKPEDIK